VELRLDQEFERDEKKSKKPKNQKKLKKNLSPTQKDQPKLIVLFSFFLSFRVCVKRGLGWNIYLE
jgi:hypothetical protein